MSLPAFGNQLPLQKDPLCDPNSEEGRSSDKRAGAGAEELPIRWRAGPRGQNLIFSSQGVDSSPVVSHRCHCFLAAVLALQERQQTDQGSPSQGARPRSCHCGTDGNTTHSGSKGLGQTWHRRSDTNTFYQWISNHWFSKREKKKNDWKYESHWENWRPNNNYEMFLISIMICSLTFYSVLWLKYYTSYCYCS